MSKQENVSNTLEIDNTTTRSKLYETEGKSQFLESENKQLKRDKELLIDHVAELQRQVIIAFQHFMILFNNGNIYLT